MPHAVTLAPTPDAPKEDAGEVPTAIGEAEEEECEVAADPTEVPPVLGDPRAKAPTLGAHTLSKNAIKCRARRIFKPRSNGTLKVSEVIYNEWHHGGEPRKSLETIFRQCGYNVDTWSQHELPILVGLRKPSLRTVSTCARRSASASLSSKGSSQQKKRWHRGVGRSVSVYRFVLIDSPKEADPGGQGALQDTAAEAR